MNVGVLPQLGQGIPLTGPNKIPIDALTCRVDMDPRAVGRPLGFGKQVQFLLELESVAHHLWFIKNLQQILRQSQG
ncbi:hypothetical protein DEDE109153_08160 [Deinococcus deserti]